MKRRTAALAAAAVGALAIGAAAVTEKVTEPTAQESTIEDGFAAAAESGGGFYYARCERSHVSSDDPIVHPAMPGMAHQTTADPVVFAQGTHVFFGSRIVAANTTPEELTADGTTCRDRQIRNGYWIQRTSFDGRVFDPLFLNVRHGRGPAGQKANAVNVLPMPPGMRLVAGSNAKYVQWNCNPTAPKVEDKTRPPDCGPDRELTLNITFPQCWNGELDSPDHRSHVVYPRNGVCPASHPLILQSLQMKAHWGRGAVPSFSAASLASGGDGLSAHADLFVQSDTDRQDLLNAYCVVGGRNCGEAATPPP